MIKGSKHTKEALKKISINTSIGVLKRRDKLGYINSPETREKLKKSKSEEHKQKLKESHWSKTGIIEPPMKNKHHTEESKRKISYKTKIEMNKLDIKQLLSNIKKGKPLSVEHKKKIRENVVKYIKNVCGDIRPNIGKEEKQILDNMEEKIGYKIIRQYEVLGYFVDGYCQELKLAIEVDEKHHNKQKEKDLFRQKEIENKLNCNFIRIKND